MLVVPYNWEHKITFKSHHSRNVLDRRKYMTILAKFKWKQLLYLLIVHAVNNPYLVKVFVVTLLWNNVSIFMQLVSKEVILSIVSIIFLLLELYLGRKYWNLEATKDYASMIAMLTSFVLWCHLSYLLVLLDSPMSRNPGLIVLE